MSVRVVCALCGRDLIRVGVTSQLRCPVHGSRGVKQQAQRRESPSKPVLGHPDYSAGTEDR